MVECAGTRDRTQIIGVTGDTLEISPAPTPSHLLSVLCRNRTRCDPGRAHPRDPEVSRYLFNKHCEYRSRTCGVERSHHGSDPGPSTIDASFDATLLFAFALYRCCSPRLACSVCCRISWLNARSRSAFASRSARSVRKSCALCSSMGFVRPSLAWCWDYREFGAAQLIRRCSMGRRRSTLRSTSSSAQRCCSPR